MCGSKRNMTRRKKRASNKANPFKYWSEYKKGHSLGLGVGVAVNSRPKLSTIHLPKP